MRVKANSIALACMEDKNGDAEAALKGPKSNPEYDDAVASRQSFEYAIKSSVVIRNFRGVTLCDQKL